MRKLVLVQFPLSLLMICAQNQSTRDVGVLAVRVLTGESSLLGIPHWSTYNNDHPGRIDHFVFSGTKCCLFVQYIIGVRIHNTKQESLQESDSASEIYNP